MELTVKIFHGSLSSFNTLSRVCHSSTACMPACPLGTDLGTLLRGPVCQCLNIAPTWPGFPAKPMTLAWSTGQSLGISEFLYKLTVFIVFIYLIFLLGA